MFLVSWWVELLGMGWFGAALALWLAGVVVPGCVIAAVKWVELVREGMSLLRGGNAVAGFE
jgi:hypothetical protein